MDRRKLMIGVSGGMVLLSCGAFWGWNQLSLFNVGTASSCIQYRFENLNPLLVGKTETVRLASIENGSDCTGKAKHESVLWSSENPAVATIAPDGTIMAIAPGKFRIIAKAGSETLLTSGVVYPPRWIARIQPETATIRVGETITFHMVATDAQNQPLPTVFTLFTTPDYQFPHPDLPDPTPNPTPWMDRSFHGMGATPGTFRALRPGTLKITGRMGGQTRQATVTIEK